MQSGMLCSTLSVVVGGEVGSMMRAKAKATMAKPVPDRGAEGWHRIVMGLGLDGRSISTYMD